MKYLIFIFICSFSIQILVSQEQHTKPYYIWAKSGLSLRKTPDKNAEKLTIIPYSSKVTFISFTSESYTVTEFDGFQYTTNWAKVSYNNNIGYAFAGYLSTIKPPKISENYGIQEYLDDYFTKTDLIAYSTYENCSGEHIRSCITSGLISYKEGISYSFWSGEGGGTDTLSIPNLNILQAYTLGTIFCPSYNDFEITYTENPLPTIVVMRDDVGCDFTITVLGDYAIIHWSGGC